MSKNISQHAVIWYVQLSVKINFLEHNEVVEIKTNEKLSDKHHPLNFQRGNVGRHKPIPLTQLI